MSFHYVVWGFDLGQAVQISLQVAAIIYAQIWVIVDSWNELTAIIRQENWRFAVVLDLNSQVIHQFSQPSVDHRCSRPVDQFGC